MHVNFARTHFQGKPVSTIDFPFFAKFFAKNLFTFFAFFAKKRGAKNAEKMSYFRLFRSDFNVSFAKMHCFRLEGLIPGVIGIFKWL